MVWVASNKITRVPFYSGTLHSNLSFRIRDFNSVPCDVSTTSTITCCLKVGPTTPDYSGLTCSAFARRYLRNRFSFFSCRYLDVSVPCVSPPMRYLFSHGYLNLTSDGFPHSDIAGSLRAYRSPTRFAVRCVLLRLLVPRHSPYALLHLT